MTEKGEPADRHERSARQPVVTGAGIVCSAGIGRKAVVQALDVAPMSIRAPLYDPRADGVPSPPAPLFRPDWNAVAPWIAGARFAGLTADPELRLAAAAAALAVEDANLEDGLARGALVATWEAPGMDRFLRGLLKDFLECPTLPPKPEEAFERLYLKHKEAAYTTQSFLHLHLLARAFEMHGPTLFVNNACASGLYALDAAASFVLDGKADVAIVVAAESPCFPTKQRWFADGGLHSTDGFLRPFDSARTGLILGEGAAALVIEPLERARARRARVLAEYLGGHFNQEGWKVTVPNFAQPFHEEVIRGACAAARIEPASLDAIVAHGAGTALSDAYEAKGITSVFGEWPAHPTVTALKGWFGHTLGASALLELAVSLSCLHEGFLPGSAGFETPDPKLRVRLATGPARVRSCTLLKISNGFAGFNAGAVLRVKSA